MRSEAGPRSFLSSLHSLLKRQEPLCVTLTRHPRVNASSTLVADHAMWSTLIRLAGYYHASLPVRAGVRSRSCCPGEEAQTRPRANWTPAAGERCVIPLE